jgi:hypothetical protein
VSRPEPSLPLKKAAADILLEQSDALLLPWVRELVRHGVTYPQLSLRLKQVFFDAARAERAHVLAVQPGPAAASIPLSSQIVTRWVSDPQYRDQRGKPRDLPRHGAIGSFEALVNSVSKDVHPRTALEELVRLGVVTLQGERVCMNGDAFVPRHGFAELAELLARNVADHIAAGTHNLEAEDAARFLEQSVFAQGLSAESAAELGDVARKLWGHAFERMVAQATTRVARDKASAEPRHRMRFGVFFYSDPDE